MRSWRARSRCRRARRSAAGAGGSPRPPAARFEDAGRPDQPRGRYGIVDRPVATDRSAGCATAMCASADGTAATATCSCWRATSARCRPSRPPAMSSHARASGRASIRRTIAGGACPTTNSGASSTPWPRRLGCPPFGFRRSPWSRDRPALDGGGAPESVPDAATPGLPALRPVPCLRHAAGLGIAPRSRAERGADASVAGQDSRQGVGQQRLQHRVGGYYVGPHGDCALAVEARDLGVAAAELDLGNRLETGSPCHRRCGCACSRDCPENAARLPGSGP